MAIGADRAILVETAEELQPLAVAVRRVSWHWVTPIETTTISVAVPAA